MKFTFDCPSVLFAEDFDHVPTTTTVTYEEDYFIIGRTLNGGFYISEYLSEDEIRRKMIDYSDIVHYFGGGTVDICRKFEDSYEVVSSKVIW